MVGLGDLPGGGFQSFANSTNGDGSVVVGAGITASGNEAFYWNVSVGMDRLWDVLLDNGVDPAADGWTRLVTAGSVSTDGYTVAGWGIRNGNNEAFVAVVPEPATLSVLALGAGLTALRRRQR
jgi:hypothetical protein